MKNFTLTCCFIIICTFTANLLKAQVNISDSLALVDLYDSTGGPQWRVHQNWLTTKPVSTWVGVKVTNTRVTQLFLSSNNMKDSLPESIGNLTALTFFELSFDSLKGTLPQSIGNLVNLTRFAVFANGFSGTVPASIGNLTQLNTLLLNGNKFTGSLPSSIGNLVNLVSFSIYNNQFSGSIPASIGNLTKVTDLEFHYNQLSGNIPASMGNMKSLTYCNLSSNNLSGALPKELGNLYNLYSFQAQINQLTGEIPVEFFKLSKISGIDVSSNHLTQSPGYTFPGIKKRELYLNLSSNEFTFDGLEYATRKFNDVQYYVEKNLTIHKAGNVLSVYAGGTLSNNTYTWYNSAGTVVATIVGDSTFTPSASGVYHVSVKNAIARLTPINSDDYNYVVNAIAKQTTSNAGAATLTGFIIYPNPAAKTLYIQSNREANICITDMFGKTLISKKINGKTSIDISALANGVYYLKDISDGYTKQFVKFGN